MRLGELTTRVVAGSEEDATGRLSYPDDVTGGRCAHDSVLADQELLDAVGSAHLGDGLGDLGVPVTAITTDDEGGALSTFGDGGEDGGNEVLGVVGLLEHLDLLAEAGAVREGGVSWLFGMVGWVSGRVFGGALTYVPGFWSWKGLVSTVWTLMIAMLCVCEERRMRVEREEVKKCEEG